MSQKLAAELRQKRPFQSLEQEALLNLLRTHEYIQQRQSEFFKQFQLTSTQYNVLRILRGAGDEGLTCSGVGERMISADPDVTRLFDRLESRKLIRRERSREDRRVVITYITPEGLELLSSIDKPVEQFLKRAMGRVGRDRLREFIQILESIREE